MGKWLRFSGVGLVCLLSACGADSDEDEEPPGNSGPTGGAADGGYGGGASGSGTVAGSNAGGLAGKGGSASGTGGTAGTVDCSGAFGPSKTLVSLGVQVIASLTITEDELELYYVEVSEAAGYPISVLRRSSRTAAFPSAPERVPELQAACAANDYPTVDVSNDGLRMYITCLDGSSPLRLAMRASRTASWTVAANQFGTVADSIGVSDDELTAVAVTNLLEEARPVLYQRASRDAAFGAEQAIPGINEVFRNPDLVDNGRQLFGVITVGNVNRIATSALSGASATSFSAPSTTGMPAPPTEIASSASDFTPTVTPDCRTMYFLRDLRLDVGHSWTIEMAER